jgi:AcrR family transcriptional regulator
MKSKVYQAMHDERNQEILSTVKKMIVEDGLLNLSMSSIALTLKISRQTLYKYFHSLADIAYRIQDDDMLKVNEYFGTFLPRLQGTATDKLLGIVDEFFAYEEAHLPDFIFTYYFDSYFNAHSNREDLKADYQKIIGAMPMFREIACLIEEGKADGTIRKDIDTPAAVSFFSNTLQSLVGRLAIFAYDEESLPLFDRKNIHNEFLVAFRRYLRP